MALLAAGDASATPPRDSHAEAVRALQAARTALATPLAAGDPAHGSRDVTLVLRDLALAAPALDPRRRRAARRLLSRPSQRGDRDYFGPEAPDSPRCDDHFCVHWSNVGESAPSGQTDPDAVLAALQHSRAVENGALGWRRPKPDGKAGTRNGRGREGQTDAYLANLPEGLYGYATVDPGQSGLRRSAYLVLDNDYTGFPSPPLASMQVTVAHEYNHVLQFNYDSLQESWLFESTATWIEEHVYSELDDYLNYLGEFAERSTTPMTGGSTKVYGEAVWNHWLEHRYGPAVVRRTWEVSRKARHVAVDAYERSIAQAGGVSFSRDFAAFAAATAEWQSHPAFPDAAHYPKVRRTGKLRRLAGSVALGNTSFALLNVPIRPGNGPVKLVVRAPRGVRSAIALVGRRGPLRSDRTTTRSAFVAEGGRATVTLRRPRRFARITAAIVDADGRRVAFRYRGDGARYRYRLGR